jgi:hypothetical protein
MRDHAAQIAAGQRRLRDMSSAITRGRCRTPMQDEKTLEALSRVIGQSPLHDAAV